MAGPRLFAPVHERSVKATFSVGISDACAGEVAKSTGPSLGLWTIRRPKFAVVVSVLADSPEKSEVRSQQMFAAIFYKSSFRFGAVGGSTPWAFITLENTSSISAMGRKFP